MKILFSPDAVIKGMGNASSDVGAAIKLWTHAGACLTLYKHMITRQFHAARLENECLEMF